MVLITEYLYLFSRDVEWILINVISTVNGVTMCSSLSCEFIFQRPKTAVLVAVIFISASVTQQTEAETTLSPNQTSAHNDNSTSDPSVEEGTTIYDRSDDWHSGGEHGKDGITLIPVHFSHVEYPLIFSLVVIFAGLSKLAFHYSHFLSSKVPESWYV